MLWPINVSFGVKGLNEGVMPVQKLVKPLKGHKAILNKWANLLIFYEKCMRAGAIATGVWVVDPELYMHTSHCTLTGQQLFHMTQLLHSYVQLVYDCGPTHQPVAVKQDPPQLSASSQSLLHFSQFQSSQCHATLHWGRKPSHWCSRGMLLMPFSDSIHTRPQWVSMASQ